MMESCRIYFDTGTFHVSTCCRLRHLLCTVLFFCSCPCRNPHHIHRTLHTGINYLYLSLSWCLLLVGFLNHPRYQGQIRVAFMQNSVHPGAYPSKKGLHSTPVSWRTPKQFGFPTFVFFQKNPTSQGCPSGTFDRLCFAKMPLAMLASSPQDRHCQIARFYLGGDHL